MDDTLYDELTYVGSGFQAVATFLNDKYGIPQKDAFAHMWSTLQSTGRGAVFNIVLQEYGLESITMVKECVKQYRFHTPKIQMFPDAIQAFEHFGSFPIYVVTDGHKEVQHKKAEALGLYDLVEKCYITHRYGRRHAKPSPYCFQQIMKREKVAPFDIVYVGDNVNKDFVGIKPLGFHTIQIARGSFKDVVMPKAYQAEWKINSLTELFDIIKR